MVNGTLMKFFKDMLNNDETKLGEQINPRSELNEWLWKLTFQRKAGGDKLGMVLNTVGCWGQKIIKDEWWQFLFKWRHSHGLYSHVHGVWNPLQSLIITYSLFNFKKVEKDFISRFSTLVTLCKMWFLCDLNTLNLSQHAYCQREPPDPDDITNVFFNLMPFMLWDNWNVLVTVSHSTSFCITVEQNATFSENRTKKEQIKLRKKVSENRRGQEQNPGVPTKEKQQGLGKIQARF